MMLDEDQVHEYFNRLAERYTAPELVEEMNLDVWDVIEMFQDELLEKPIDVERYRKE